MSQAVLFGVEQAELTSDDYYTPAWVFERMGIEFDLDVASPPGGIPWIPAKRYFTMADDGLSQPWEGRVWMNPPYSRPVHWVNRFMDHGHGVALLPMAKSAWFDRVWSDAHGIAITPGGGRSFFVKPGSDKPLDLWLPCLYVAMGPECVEAISRLGRVR